MLPRYFRLTPFLFCFATFACDRLPGTRPPAAWPTVQPDLAIDAPASAAGQPLPPSDDALLLNVRPGTGIGEPEITADVEQGPHSKLKLTETAPDGKFTTPLRSALTAGRDKHRQSFRILINAPRDLTYAQFQLILQQCAMAGVPDFGLVTRPSVAGDASGRHFLPGAMPITERKSGDSPGDTPGPEVEIFLKSVSSTGGKQSFEARIGADAGVITDAEALATALAAKRKAMTEAGTATDNVTLLLSPRLTTRYEHVIAAYDAATRADWPKIGFRSATD